jgi:hypothetical protein
MTARERILRDNGLLTIATVVALATAGGAAASARPMPHNFVHPSPHNFVHPMPHNFAAHRELT